MLSILIILIIAVLGIFVAWPLIGLYCLVATLPIIGLDISWGAFEIPLADFIALLVLVSFLINRLLSLVSNKENRVKLSWPLFFPFLVFFIVSLISILLSTDSQQSFYYFLRWPLFLYFAYIWAPANLIKNPRILKRSIIVLFLSSMVVLLSSYLSLIGQSWYSNFFRIQAINLFNFYPFGDNHNLIAEFLNVGAFLVLIIKEFLKEQRWRRLADIVFLVTALGIVLSFSRSGWITLLLQLVIYLAYKSWRKKKEKLSLILLACLALLIISPFLWKMEKIQQHNVGSTDSRILLNEVSWKAFQEKPLFGHGNGQFINLVDRNIRFRAQHGPAIDSHGLIQKIIVENGLMGLLAWLLIFAYLIKIAYQSLKRYYPSVPWILPLCLAVGGGIFFQFFNTSYFKGKVWLPILLLLLAIKFLEERYARKNKGAPPIT